MRKRRVLVTNDDGLASGFLRVLVEALAGPFDVTVVAPAREQSWISRAVTRHRPLRVEGREGFGVPAWAVDGTPTDCVNLAFGQLLEERPELVVSGLNIGQNAGLPYILASGTVAGALEGSLQGAHAVAVSQWLEPGDFGACRDGARAMPAPIRALVERSAGWTARFCEELLKGVEGGRRYLVHNINFPSTLPPEGKRWASLETVPGDVRYGSLFAREGEGYSFRYHLPERLKFSEGMTDREAMELGAVSHSRLDFAQLACIPLRKAT